MGSLSWPRQSSGSCNILIEPESFSETTSDSSSVVSSATHSSRSSTRSSASSPNSEGSPNTLRTDVDEDNISNAGSTLTSTCTCNVPRGHHLPNVSPTGIEHIENCSRCSDVSSEGGSSHQGSSITPSLHSRPSTTTTTEDPEEESTEKKTNKKCRGCLKISLALIVFVGISAGVAFTTFYFISKKLTQEPVFTKADMSVRVMNETFEDAMMESTSSEFKDFAAKFCTNVLSELTEKVDDARCQVHSLSRGSIVVKFTLELLAPENVTLHLLEEWLSVPTLGVMTLDPSSLHVLSNATEKEFHLTKDEPSSCSAEYLPLQPLSYTFPHHCQDYRVCVDGSPLLEKCPDGQEFAFTSPDDKIICAPPSPHTYCGKKRLQTETQRPTTTTTTTTTTTATTTATTDITSQDLASPSTTPTTLSLLSSPDVHRHTPMIISTKSTEGVLPTLDGVHVSFKCPRTGRHYLPAVDTYPSNCGKYQDCNEGHSENMSCPLGTMFIYKVKDDVCDSILNPSAFCNLMENGRLTDV